MLSMVSQVNPLLVPLQVPERFSPARHVLRSHVWHVPGLAPERYWLAVQRTFGMVVHMKPLIVPLQEPERISPVGHALRSHVRHVPGLAPTRY